MDNWIKVEDRLPKAGQEVDIWYDGKRLPSYKLVRNYGGQKGNDFFDPVISGIVCIRPAYDVDDGHGATHWMPLPEPPSGN